MPIQLLDPITITQIQAGEVIERPASVVKELIENALDAGATKLLIAIENGGKSYIQVTDNGQGIPPEELPLAPVQHTTSKIQKIEDLFGVQTFGFRGEALASMAHVGELTITSRTPHSAIGYKVTANLNTISEPTPIAHTIGTTVTLSDLFSKIPVRQQFLKSAGTEIGYIYDVVLHQILIRPEVEFKLTHDGKVLLDSTGISSLDLLLHPIIGKELQNQWVPISTSHGNLTLKGLLGKPTLTFGSRAKQWLAVNGRPIKSGLLQKAVNQAYAMLIPAGRFPLVVLDICPTPEDVDVNIHPQKLDVKFLNTKFLFDSLPAMIRQAFNPASTHPLGTFPPTHLQHPTTYPTTQPHMLTPEWDPAALPLFTQMGTPNVSLDQTSTPFIQVFDTYIVLKTPAGITILDQHAVHERVMYERLKKGLSSSGALQPLALGQVIDLSPPQMSVFLELQKDLYALGFVIDEFGSNSVIIKEVPIEWAAVSMGDFLIEFLNNYKETQNNTPELESARRAALQQQSCKSAIKAGKIMSTLEVDALVREFLSIPDRETCPHGRPVSITLDKTKLEKLFLRS